MQNTNLWKGIEMNKKWQVYQVENDEVEKLQEKYKINKLLATILVNRGIMEEEQIEKFLKPKRSDFYNPYGMPGYEYCSRKNNESNRK